MLHTIESIQAYVARLYADKRTGVVPRHDILPYSYPLPQFVINAAAVNTQPLQMQANSDFLCLEISAFASLAAVAETNATQVIPQATMLITDTGSNQPWSNAAVMLPNYASLGQFQRALSFPRLVQGRSALNIVTTNVSAAENYTMNIALHGVLVFLYN